VTRTTGTSGSPEVARAGVTAADAAPQAAADATPPASSRSADGRPQRDPEAVRAFIERFTGLLTLTGFPRTPARIFVALLTSDSSRLTAAELADLLEASPASVSGGVRYLLQVGLITAEGERGSRRLHYRMSPDVWQDIVRLRATQFTRWAAELRDGVSVLGVSSPAGDRMAATVNYFEFISEEITSLLARWNERLDASESRHASS
jgi:DNA-binding transcriptional regulator GbsR (MarR family)